MSEQETKMEEPQQIDGQQEAKKEEPQQTNGQDKKKTPDEPNYITTADFAKNVISSLRKIKDGAIDGVGLNAQLASTMDSIEFMFTGYSGLFFVVPTTFVNVSRLLSVKIASSASVQDTSISGPSVAGRVGYAGVVAGLGVVAAAITTAKYVLYPDSESTESE